jgi:hypothetical protein
LQKPEVDDQLILLLEDLARFRQAGFHLITGSSSLLKTIANLSNLSRRSSNLYLQVRDELIQLHYVTTLLARRIEITDGYATKVIDHSDGRKTFQIPYRSLKLQTPCVFNKTILLCENILDSKIYARIAEAYIAMNKLDVTLNLEKRGGGGSTIASEYHEVQQTQERLCLCVVDSDKKTPKSTIGSTAKSLRDKDDSNVLLCEVTIIEPRDIENLFPTSILREIVQDTNNKLSTIKMLETMDTCSANSDARYYLDIKKGITLGEVLTSPEQEEFHQYWKKILAKHGFSEKFSCSVSGNCNKPRKCSCIIAEGLGDKIAEEFHDKFLRMTSPHKIVERVSTIEHLRSNWESIGKIITAWGCGGYRKIT